MTSHIIKEEQKNLTSTIKTIEKLITDLKEEERLKRNDPSLPGNALAKKRISQYSEARKSLYHGRVDVLENDVLETWYIGEIPVTTDNIENIIYDWRSPAGDTFHAFFGGNGQISYQVKKGNQTHVNTVTVLRKRDISHKNDKVINTNDVYSEQASKHKRLLESNLNTDVTTTINTHYSDSFLAELLQESHDEFGIKKVIASIQKEQNEAIRLGIRNPIIIQGVAGSGKSTIALNRISFLLYRYRDSLKANRILILAPNAMFLSYIQGVLPSLEIGNIQQETFISFTKSILPTLGNVIEPYETLAAIVNREESLETVSLISSFKGSIIFKNILDKYFNSLEEHLSDSIPIFEFWDQYSQKNVTFSKEDIESTLGKNTHLPIEKRRQAIFKTIENYKNQILLNRQKSFESEFDTAIKVWVEILPTDNKLRKEMRESLEKVRDYKIRDFRKQLSSAWTSFKTKWKPYLTLELYKQVLQPELLLSLQPDLDNHILSIIPIYNGDKTYYEDLAALLYIENKLNGFIQNFDYIVIDEAQDFSPFQFYVLNQVTKSMTILGDVTQSIYSYTGINQWEEITNTIWKEDIVTQIKLDISYRSTFEIMNTANHVLTNSNLPYNKIIPFRRHGESVKIAEISNEYDLLEKILHSLNHFYAEGCKKVAIIHKDTERCEGLYESLKEEGLTSVQLVLDPNQEVDSNIIIIPSYLVKGFEFDAVVIPNANEDNYKNNELDAKLLFISLTRPHHYLHIYFHKKVSPLLKNCIVESDMQEKKKKKLSIL